MRELIRTTEGVITSAEFRKGGIYLLVLTTLICGLLFGISVLSHRMEWMTVAVAPFLGVVVLFAVCSLIYFWYCIFTKRMRALKSPQMLVNAWLGAMFVASALRLVDYQNRTLSLADMGVLAYSGFGALVFSLISVFLFVLLIFRGWKAD